MQYRIRNILDGKWLAVTDYGTASRRLRYSNPPRWNGRRWVPRIQASFVFKNREDAMESIQGSKHALVAELVPYELKEARRFDVAEYFTGKTYAIFNKKTKKWKSESSWRNELEHATKYENIASVLSIFRDTIKLHAQCEIVEFDNIEGVVEPVMDLLPEDKAEKAAGKYTPVEVGRVRMKIAQNESKS